MAEFLSTTATALQIENLAEQAQERLTLVTPYVQLPQMLFNRLREAEQRGVQIRFIYGKQALKSVELEKLRSLRNITLYYYEHLHAKCYATEQSVIVSSMNLYGYSERTNWEMSVLLTSADGEAFIAAHRDVEKLINASEKQYVGGSVRAALAAIFQPAKASRPAASQHRVRSGHCVRCGSSMRYRPQAPLCDTCYPSWAVWGNENYPERNCHRCGSGAEVSKGKPLCRPCFRAEPFVAA